MEVQKDRYPSLNGLRALSILLVVSSHLGIKENWLAKIEEYRWLRPFTKLIQEGNLGVNVFFVISGFLITSLMLNEEDNTKIVSLRKFYIRRTLRIFPAYYFLLLVYFVLQLFNVINLSDISWITAITYTKYFNLSSDWITSHGWSLSVEEHFYLFWPLIFVYGYQYREKAVVALILLVPIVRIALHFYPIDWIDQFTIFTRIDAIATGCLFALYKDKIVEKIQTHWKKVFYLSIITIVCLPSLNSIFRGTIFAFIFIPLGTTYGTIANFDVGLLMMYSIFGPQKLWFKFLNLKIINFIGLLSYSIYLWQQIFISGLDYWVTTYPQNLLLLCIVAIGSYYIIEKPFLSLKKRWA